MKELEKTFDRIVQRVNINCGSVEFDVHPLVNKLVPTSQMTKFYAFTELPRIILEPCF